jgi:hypothetical protein
MVAAATAILAKRSCCFCTGVSYIRPAYTPRERNPMVSSQGNEGARRVFYSMYYVYLAFVTIPTTVVVNSIKCTGPFGGFEELREKYVLPIKSEYYA